MIRQPAAKLTRCLGPSRHLGAYALIAACIGLLFWPIWLLSYRFPIGGGDLWGQLQPVWSYVAGWMHRGIFPMWSTRMMAGDPIISEMQYGLLNPLNWLMFLLNPAHPWVISLRGMFSLWLAGAGTYLYLHTSEVWRLRAPSALIGAVAYACSDPFIVHLGHPQFNDTMAWLPWVLLGIDRAASNRRYICWAGLGVALLIVAGHGQAALYALACVAAYALWRSLAVPSSTALRLRAVLQRLGRLALAAGIAACLAAPAWLPALERLPNTERASLPAGATEYELPAAMLLDLLTPQIHGRTMKGFWAPWDRVESPYVGAAALALAALGIGLGLRRARVWSLIFLGAAATLYALGTQGPLYPLVRSLPLLSATWKTSRVIYLLSFALACAAAEGAERLFEHQQAQRVVTRIWGPALAMAGITLLVAAPALARSIPSGAPRLNAIEGLRVAGLMWTLLGLTASVCAGRTRTRALVLAIVIIEAVCINALVDVEPLPKAENDPHLAALAYLREDTGWFRVDVDGKARGLWSPAAVMAAGFDVPQGTGNPMELVVYTQFYWGIPSKSAPAYSQLGAKYIVVPKGAQPGGEGIWPVFWDDPLIDIHLNTNALPRVWLVYRTVPVLTLEEAYAVTLRDAFVPTALATVRDGPQLGGSGQGTLEVLGYGPNRVAIQVETSEQALLVLSDLDYPGWRAVIDGKRVPLYATNGIFRGVVVPAGAHRVEMRFFPTSFAVGLGLAALAIASIATSAWGMARRQAQVHAQRGTP